MSDNNKKTNQNTSYEILAKDIYQVIHDSEGFENIDVRHNVKLSGKSGCKHQIDVYWEFKMAGEIHKVAIECKNYSSSVSVGRIRDFFGVLHDIGNIKGIFITKEGYQSGAKKFANYYSISIKELRFPKPEDWSGRVKDMVVRIIFCEPIITKTEIEYDTEWLKNSSKIKEEDKTQIDCLENEIKILDEGGKLISTLFDIKNELPQEYKEEEGLVKKYNYDSAFISIEGSIPLKIKGIKITYDNKETVVSESKTEGEAIAKAILKDVETGDIKFFDRYGNIK